jgi:trimeric autotransporter adhesin
MADAESFLFFSVSFKNQMTYVSALIAQADPGIVSGSTIERKKMSTKTIYKRIALVAVTALGAGVLSVAPANAASSASTWDGAAANTTKTVAVGGTVTTRAGATLAAEGPTGGNVLTLTTPTQSTVTFADGNGALATTVDPIDLTVETASGAVTAALSGSDMIATLTTTSNAAVAAVLADIKITPDVPGTYQITFAAGSGTTRTLTILAGNFIDTDTTTAASKNLACTVGATITGTTCAGVAGGRVGVLFNNLTLGTAATYFVTATGGSIVGTVGRSSNPGTDLTVTNTNASNLNDGVSIAQTASNVTAGEGVEILVSRADAGSVVINVQSFNATTGIRETVATGTVTFGSAAALDIATVEVYGVSNGTCAGTETASTITYAAKDNSSGLGICVITKNGAGSAIASSLSIVGNGTGLIGGAAVAALTTADGSDHFAVTGNGLSGTGKFTVTATDVNKKVATGSIDIRFFDSVASIVITQTKWGLLNGDANDNTAIATFSAKDKNGFPVAFGTAGASNLVVDSDVASTQTIAVAGDNDSSATETLAASTVSALGVETAGTITVDVSSTFEKVTLKIHNSTNTVPSNTITFHSTTNLFSTLVVGAVDAAAGTSQSVTATGVAKITGKTGYIISDAATATFFATAGTLASTSAVNFKNGVATVSYATPLLGGSVSITATPSETTTVASAVKAIAISSAANAELATLTTLVNSLIAKINALNKLVIKIQKKVRA